MVARKFRNALGAVSFLALVAQGATVTAETLREAMVSAYNHSGLIEQNRALLRVADENVAQAVAGLKPIVNWSSSVSRSFGSSTTNSALYGLTTNGVGTTNLNLGITAELTLYDGGLTKFAIEAAKENVLATRQRLVEIEQQVLITAVQSYMDVRRAAETVALRTNNLRVISEELRAAQDRFDVGEVTKTDVALAEARLAASKSALAAAKGDLAATQERYRAAVGRRAGQLATPTRLPTTASSTDAAKAAAVRAHPAMLRMQHSVKAADLSIERAKSGMKPKVKLSGSVALVDTFGEPTHSGTGSVSLGVSGPIYQGGRLSSLVRQAQAQRDATRAELHTTRHTLQQNAAIAFVQLQVSKAALEAADERIRAARVAFRGVREEATLGARTTLDVLNAEQEMLDAQAARITAVVDQQIAAYSLLAQMGKLTVAELNLPVQRYDPAAYYNLVKTAPAQRSKQGKKLDRVLESLGKN